MPPKGWRKGRPPPHEDSEDVESSAPSPASSSKIRVKIKASAREGDDDGEEEDDYTSTREGTMGAQDEGGEGTPRTEGGGGGDDDEETAAEGDDQSVVAVEDDKGNVSDASNASSEGFKPPRSVLTSLAAESGTRGSGRPRGRPRGSKNVRGRGRGRGRGGSALQRARELARRPLTGEESGGYDGEGLLKGDEPGSSGGGSKKRTVMGVDYDYFHDELVIEDDVEGDKKVDRNGKLLGGREYKATVFASAYRDNPEKLYLLSIDAARTCGYKDSLYFFRRNKTIVKITLAGAEKDALIDEGVIGTQFKTRSVTMIAARNCYKLQGAKMLKHGHHVTDDYYEEAARATCIENGIEPGTPVGDLPDPALPLSDRAVALEAASAFSSSLTSSTARIDRTQPFYTPGGPTTHFPSGSGLDPFSDIKARGMGMGKLRADRKALKGKGWDRENWMEKVAREVVQKNRELERGRRERLSGGKGSGREGFLWEKFGEWEDSEEVGGDADDESGKGKGRARGKQQDEEEDPLALVGSGSGSRKSSRKGKEREGSLTAIPSRFASPMKVSSPLARAVSVDEEEDGDVKMEDGVRGGLGEADGVQEPKKKKPRVVGPPLTFYDPHTHLPHVRLTTQPTSSSITRLSPLVSLTSFDTLSPSPLDPSIPSHRSELGVLGTLGGTSKVGHGSWGLASVVVSMAFDVIDEGERKERERAKEEEMWALVREAERAEREEEEERRQQEAMRS